MADLPTKRHPTAHHINMRPQYVLNAAILQTFKATSHCKGVLNTQIRYPQRIGIPAPARYATASFSKLIRQLIN